MLFEGSILILDRSTRLLLVKASVCIVLQSEWRVTLSSLHLGTTLENNRLLGLCHSIRYSNSHSAKTVCLVMRYSNVFIIK